MGHAAAPAVDRVLQMPSQDAVRLIVALDCGLGRTYRGRTTREPELLDEWEFSSEETVWSDALRRVRTGGWRPDLLVVGQFDPPTPDAALREGG